MWYELRIKIYFLHVDIQFSQHRLLKGLSFPRGVLAPCQDSRHRMSKSFFLGRQFCVRKLAPHRFDYCHFVVNFSQGFYPALFFFLKSVLTTWDPLQFHLNVRIGFFIALEKAVVISRGIVKSSCPGQGGVFYLFRSLTSFSKVL